ncbi:hypothetical protein XENORESO_012718 [Xenotaenia resolanae]|uniref:Uncharacterized protein n=1 Tax=Xenotaenia resolanae TaxID=208358 RepID=A0ABV0WED9_9TELE
MTASTPMSGHILFLQGGVGWREIYPLRGGYLSLKGMLPSVGLPLPLHVENLSQLEQTSQLLKQNKTREPYCQKQRLVWRNLTGLHRVLTSTFLNAFGMN